ncbi:ammonium transporter [Gayadomonas joobiniege]|uniref:ammonium transporter n=1 Tax=Gayadomonas joobiniege TaxID=1234606 RepID=UPI00036AE915|nr:ammonium transporter [Gayadomonas joobiniege]
MNFDVFWLVVCSILVLIMQGGFLLLESGMTRSKNAVNVALKNISDLLLTLLVWWVSSYAITFGFSLVSSFGSTGFFFDGERYSSVEISFFVFQAMFCATAATIVSGAVAERTRFTAYKIITLLIVALVYPIFAHWVWAGALRPELGTGWLAQLGFIDFAGSTVVHSVGGWVALAAVLIIGPRQGRFTKDGRITPIAYSNLPAAALGAILFLIGWIGFNAGSTLAFNDKIPQIVLNTLLAAAAGGAVAHLLSNVKKHVMLDPSTAGINGLIAGLVSITAACHMVSQTSAIVIGAIGAICMSACALLLGKLKIDDALGAVPVHLAAGIWGTLAVALFAQDLPISRADQLIVQLTGICLCALWAFGVSYCLLKLINKFYPFRVSPQAEVSGLNLSEHDAKNDLYDFLQSLNKQGDIKQRLPVEPYTEVGLIAEHFNHMLDDIELASGKTHAIVKDIRAGVITLDERGIIHSVNPAAQQIFEIDANQALGLPVSQIFNLASVRQKKPDGSIVEVQLSDDLLIRQNHLDIEGTTLSSGTKKYLEILITTSSHSGTDFICLVNDMTAYKVVENKLHEQRERIHTTLESIGDGVIRVNINGTVQYMNPIAQALTGWEIEKARGKQLHQIMQVVERPDQRADNQLLNKVLQTGQALVCEQDHLLFCRDGEVKVIRQTISPISNSEKTLAGAVIVFQDVTQTQAANRQLSYQASHDPLTGLVNRSEFDKRLKVLVESANQLAQAHILMYIDLDRFKLVNDLCGHNAGDELLKQLSRRLQPLIRSGDTLARLGGDEFAILLENCQSAKGVQIAERIRGEVESFRFSWQDKEFRVTASIGLIPIDADSKNSQQLLNKADTACYASKDAGRNQIYVYRNDDNQLAQRNNQVNWVSQIRDALKENRFELYHQKIKPLQEGAPWICEVLIRLRQADGSIVPPGAFLPAAERYNLMYEIDKWVITHTFKWLQQYQEQLQKNNFCLSINLSGESINKSDLSQFIESQLTEHQLDGRHIIFEVTETLAIANLAKAEKIFERLKQKNISFALDDFGSGLSSFSYLKSLPIDYLKIDGAFTRDLVDSETDQAMLQAINSIGHTLSLKTIVEYVDSEDKQNIIKKLGIDYLQGFYIHKPEPLSYKKA